MTTHAATPAAPSSTRVEVERFSCFAAFERVCILNEAPREDLRRRMTLELARVGAHANGLHVRWLHPRLPSGAIAGPARRALIGLEQALQEAVDDEVESLLVLQDDVRLARNLATRLPSLDREPWDLLHGAGRIERPGLDLVDGINLLSLDTIVHQAHFIGVRGLDLLRDLLIEIKLMQRVNAGEAARLDIDRACHQWRSHRGSLKTVYVQPPLATLRLDAGDQPLTGLALLQHPIEALRTFRDQWLVA